MQLAETCENTKTLSNARTYENGRANECTEKRLSGRTSIRAADEWTNEVMGGHTRGTD